MILYTGRVESIKNVTQFTGMIFSLAFFQFLLIFRSTTGLSLVLAVHFRVEPCQIRGPIIKRPEWGVFN